MLYRGNFSDRTKAEAPCSGISYYEEFVDKQTELEKLRKQENNTVTLDNKENKHDTTGSNQIGQEVS